MSAIRLLTSRVTGGAQNLRVRPPLLVLDEALGVLTRRSSPWRTHTRLLASRMAWNTRVTGARKKSRVTVPVTSFRDHHVDLVVLREEPEGALGAGIAQAQVDGVGGQPVVAGAWPRGRWSGSLSSRLRSQEGGRTKTAARTRVVFVHERMARLPSLVRREQAEPGSGARLAAGAGQTVRPARLGLPAAGGCF